jgi:hypothetical protein
MENKRKIILNQLIESWNPSYASFGHNYGRSGDRGVWRCEVHEGTDINSDDSYALTGPHFKFPETGYYAVYWEIMVEEVKDESEKVVSLMIHNSTEDSVLEKIVLDKTHFPEKGRIKRFLLGIDVQSTETAYEFRVMTHTNAVVTIYALGVYTTT